MNCIYFPPFEDSLCLIEFVFDCHHHPVCFISLRSWKTLTYTHLCVWLSSAPSEQSSEEYEWHISLFVMPHDIWQPCLPLLSLQEAWIYISSTLPDIVFIFHFHSIEFELARSIELVGALCLQLSKVLSVGFLSLVHDLIKLDLSCQLTDWATWQNHN